MHFRAMIAAGCVVFGVGEARASTECVKHTEPVAWAYCVTRDERSSNPDLMYFFHGIFHDETRWNDEALTLGIQSRWKETGADAPAVVAITFGKKMLITEPNESHLSGLLEFFIHVAVPEIERKLAWSAGRRLLFGESLGGFNALQAYFRAPELWDRLALACPAISTLAPEFRMRELTSYLGRTHANVAQLGTALAVARAHFPSLGSWVRSSPIELARSHLRAGLPPIFINFAERDGYGFQEGGALFIDLAREAGVKIQAVSEPVAHCKVGPVEIADFLVKPQGF